MSELTAHAGARRPTHERATFASISGLCAYTGAPVASAT